MTKLKTAACLLAAGWPAVTAQSRVMRPDDLFRVERATGIAWSSDRARVAVHITRPGRWLGASPPTGDVRVIDVASATMRRISDSGRAYVGFFGTSWSPNGRALAFFSVDTNAVVRPWVWHVGGNAPVLLRGLQMHDDLADSPVVAWSDDAHVVLLVRDTTQRNAGPLYVRIRRDRNAADGQRRALAGQVAVTVIDSHDSTTIAPRSRLVSVDVRANAITTLASGALHHPVLSADRRTVTYRQESPGAMVRPSTYLRMRGDADAAYLAVDWGTETRFVDARTGARASPPDTARVQARDTSVADLRAVSSSSEGTRLVLARRGRPDSPMGGGKAGARSTPPGKIESIAYTSATGKALTGWLLYPPNHSGTRRLPIVTMMYPGTVYSARVPSVFNVLNDDFEHPQLFAAMGYGVLLASMPVGNDGRQASSYDELTPAILPLLDTVIARGIADSARIAVLGQSSGGYAVLGLVAQTNRFRSAIASGAYSDLASDYGTFYGEYRYGDGGSPQRAQILRMLQYERGVVGAPGPPWEHPEWYRANSPLSHVASVRTPVMLIKGDADFVPLQSAEQFFTALYRQDKRAVLVRYAGEGHTITGRENVLDLWQRFGAWLRETMPE